jgi:hypothetical protein
MSRSRKIVQLVFTIFFLQLFCSCQINLEWFIRNISGKEVVLILRYDTKKIEYKHDFVPLKRKYISFSNEVLKINHKTAELVKDSLKIESLNDSTYKITIPPKSTVELTYIIPTDYTYKTNVIAEFYQDSSKYIINTMNFFEKDNKFKVGGNLTVRNVVYYDFDR